MEGKKELSGYVRVNCAPQNGMLRPQIQYLWIQPYLKIDSLKMQSSEDETITVSPNPI